ncbi:cytochrome P450 family protein [Allonocardiopsis opalescens]|uniref:Cytochrome P450 n=1 Tax=Allonocardiopsis opalescens TaxID=1144618 RepID=A0A2T0QFK3_9ACTN|nr:cytochrome P450 [Allonocardiopsis opalescens]PRY02660.1 hypothetical protein CLV72_1011263 [Allonocardiopsis opalescens]
MTTPADHAPATIDIMDSELLRDPYGGYSRLREQAPVMRISMMGGSPIWLVTRYDDVRAVLSGHGFANDAASVPGGTANLRADAMKSLGVDEDLLPYLKSVLETDPPDHTRLRKLVSRAFTVRRVAQLRPRVEEIAERLIAGLPEHAEDGAVDLIEHFAYPLPITVICELVGVAEEDRPTWRDAAAEIMTLKPGAMSRSTRIFVDQSYSLIERRRAHPQDDLVSALVRVQDEDGDRLTDREMVTMILTLVVAGHETTAHLIGTGTYALLTHPDQFALLREDPSLAPRAVHELMRWTGPVLGTRVRYATEDVEIGGTLIRRGEAVMASLAAANRDPREFGEPDRFDITREPGRAETHVGFGHGLHYCLGAALARQEGEVAFTALLRHHPGLALAVPADEVEWVPVPGLRRAARLPVRL